MLPADMQTTCCLQHAAPPITAHTDPCSPPTAWVGHAVMRKLQTMHYLNTLQQQQYMMVAGAGQDAETQQPNSPHTGDLPKRTPSTDGIEFLPRTCACWRHTSHSQQPRNKVHASSSNTCCCVAARLGNRHDSLTNLLNLTNFDGPVGLQILGQPIHIQPDSG
jgi:hypothetical protein